MKTILVIPPFTQPNTVYPSVIQLSGYLNSKGIDTLSIDMSLNVLLKLFSKDGLSNIFDQLKKINSNDDNLNRFISLEHQYTATIDIVINFLQNKNHNLANRIIKDDFLPKGEAFSRIIDEEIFFGQLGLIDKAKYYCSLYIEDVTNIIKKYISPHFGLSRYAEKISTSLNSFDIIENELNRPHNYIESLIISETINIIEKHNPEFICFSIPFPGNLLGALVSTKFIKDKYPQIKIIFGGGYVNTELRDIQDIRIFKYIDYLTYDDGELCLEKIINNESDNYLRTKYLENKTIVSKGFEDIVNLKFNDLSSPCYNGIEPNKYLFFIEVTNPMHKLWTDGFWNKLTLAHGCYWHKCSFCDITLDYIKRFEPAKASKIVDWIEDSIKQTNINSFHFTDEAAPPALLKEIALELLRRNLIISWWTNIRFEKSYSLDLCKLLSLSGCIAVSGGIEVASDRVLQLINKNINISEATIVCSNFQNTGIMVHSYLMYGFPSQTEQEIIDSLEIIRQFFANNLINSAYWHQFVLTRHSGIHLSPEKFGIKIINNKLNPFANNDLLHIDNTKIDYSKYSFGLKKALYNYMLGIGFENDLKTWFDFKTPKASINKNYIKNNLNKNIYNYKNDFKKTVYWIAGKPIYNKQNKKLIINSNSEICELIIENKLAEWIINLANIASINSSDKVSFEQLSQNPDIDFEKFYNSDEWKDIREIAVVIV